MSQKPWYEQPSILLWQEDTAVPDREKLPAAWLRIFNTPIMSDPILGSEDQGDAGMHLHSYNRITVWSCDGTEIRQMTPERVVP